MKKQKNNSYKKALRYYENGNIDKALTYLEKSISESLKNSGALNLKGLLLYLRGDLDGAVTSWKINYEFNDDAIAKGYIKDSIKDKERLEYYNKAEVLIKQYKLDEAMEYLNKCKESDFNAIKVNISLAICCFKKGKYDESSVYIYKALAIEKNNVICQNIAKDLKKYTNIDVINKEYNIKKIIAVIAVAISVTCIFVLGSKLINKDDEYPPVISDNDIEEDLEIDKEVEKPESTIDEEVIEKINLEEFEKAITNNEFEKIYSMVTLINKDTTNGKEQALRINAIEKLSNEGCKYFYENGMSSYNNEEYIKAKEDILKAYEYGTESYLYPHILFFAGAVSEKVGDKNAEKYYKEYLNNKEDNTYVEESLYKLAIFYKDEDLIESKKYAKEINQKYPKSIYNNDIIKGILNLNN